MGASFAASWVPGINDHQPHHHYNNRLDFGGCLSHPPDIPACPVDVQAKEPRREDGNSGDAGLRQSKPPRRNRCSVNVTMQQIRILEDVNEDEETRPRPLVPSPCHIIKTLSAYSVGFSLPATKTTARILNQS